MGELTPYLAVTDARLAIEWYVEHLGARVTEEPIAIPDGRVGHAELALHGAHWLVADEFPEHDSQAPDTCRGAPVTLYLAVDEVATVSTLVERALAGGAALDREPEDSEVARLAVFRDPFGHRWLVSASVAPESDLVRQATHHWPRRSRPRASARWRSRVGQAFSVSRAGRSGDDSDAGTTT